MAKLPLLAVFCTNVQTYRAKCVQGQSYNAALMSTLHPFFALARRCGIRCSLDQRVSVESKLANDSEDASERHPEKNGGLCSLEVHHLGSAQ